MTSTGGWAVSFVRPIIADHPSSKPGFVDPMGAGSPVNGGIQVSFHLFCPPRCPSGLAVSQTLPACRKLRCEILYNVGANRKHRRLHDSWTMQRQPMFSLASPFSLLAPAARRLLVSPPHSALNLAVWPRHRLVVKSGSVSPCSRVIDASTSARAPLPHPPPIDRLVPRQCVSTLSSSAICILPSLLFSGGCLRHLRSVELQRESILMRRAWTASQPLVICLRSRPAQVLAGLFPSTNTWIRSVTLFDVVCAR